MTFYQQFRTTHGQKLYEIMSFYQHRHHKIWSPPVEELRERLGVGANQYNRFDNLRRSVIDKAVGEVNDHAPFGLAVEYKRGGRGGKVSQVAFTVIPRSEIPMKDEIAKVASKNRDPDTVDLLDGKTDAERGSDLVVTSGALTEASRRLEEHGRDPLELESRLDARRASTEGSRITDPDLSFLRWLAAALNMESGLMDGLDDDILGHLVAEFD